MKITLVALNASYMHTNLAVRQIARAMDGQSPRIYEGHINLPFRQVLEDILRTQPDWIGFSCYIWNIQYVLRLVRAIKQAAPDVQILLGGPEVGHRAQAVLDAHPGVSCVVAGEGERVLPALFAALDCDGGPTAGIVGPVEPMQPSAWPDAYADGIEGLQNRILYIETSRGCPYNCQFCLSSAEDGVRALDAAESIRRLTALADGGAQLIKLVDRTFNFDRERANAIWRGLIEHAARTGYQGTYHFEIGAHLIDDAAVHMLSAAPKGLFQFEVGIQSSDEGVLSNVGRAAKFDAVARGARRVKALGTIHLHVDLIAGMPGDDMETFAQSFVDAYALGADRLQLGFLKLLHGSGLRRDAHELGIAFEPDAPYEVVRTRQMSFLDLCHLKDVENLLDWYHNSGLYTCSLRWLMKDRSPFALFGELARAMRAAGVFDAQRGEKARGAALLAAFAQDEVLEALMRHDLLKAGRRRDLPDSLAFMETEAQRALLRARFHPVRGQSCFEYEIDVEAFEQTGEIACRTTLLVYGAG